MSGGERPSRRDVLRSAVRLALVFGGIGACHKKAIPKACRNVSGLSPDDARMRTTLGYTELGADATRRCGSCQQYVAPPADGSCGACKLLKGPIHPNGTCKAFAPRSA